MTTTIQRDCGREFITILLDNGQIRRVYRQTRVGRMGCHHEFRPIAGLRGHGKWVRGCRKCGALGR